MRPALAWGVIGAILAARESAADSGWRITPSIGVQQVYTSNAVGSETNPQADLISQLTPGLGVSADTPHAQFTINYTPTYSHSDLGTSSDRVDQNLNGDGKISPFPNILTMDFQVYATETGSNGNRGIAPSTLLVPSNSRVLYYVGNLAPHFHDELGNLAEVDAIYRVNSMNSSQEGVVLPGQTSLSSSTLQRDAKLTLKGGKVFGSLTPTLSFDYIVGSGSGQNSSSLNESDILQLEYHLTYAYSITASAGYQKTHYDASANELAYNNEGATWNVGLHITPNEDSSLSLGYGLEQGIYTPNLILTYAIGQRTELTASYIVKVQTQLQSTLQNVQFLAYDQLGNPIDSRTGLPFTGVNQTFASENVLFRDKPFILSLQHQLLRSGIGLSLSYDERASVTGPPSTDTARGISVNYFRDLTPILQASVDFGFTDHVSTGTTNNGGQHTQIINADASVTYSINAKTNARLTENFIKIISNLSASSSTTNQTIIGLTRGF